MFGNLTIDQFSEELSSKSAVPGGGSVAAISASMAFSLCEMVANLTIGKKKYVEVEEMAKDIKDKSNKLRKECVSMSTKDANSFDEVMKAFSMPKETDDEKIARTNEIQKSYKIASKVPFELCQLIFDNYHLPITCMEHFNKTAVSDSTTALSLLKSAFFSASQNVFINLEGIKDEEFVAEYTEKLRGMKKAMDIDCEKYESKHTFK